VTNGLFTDGVFYAELNEFFTRELAEEGYSGVEVRVTPTVTDISTSPFVRPMLAVLT
jgi:ribosomal protein S3